MSDFDLYLRENKGFTDEDIENLSNEELERYLEEYIKFEKQKTLEKIYIYKGENNCLKQRKWKTKK